MKCIKCGKEIAEATRFCPECGTASGSQSAQPVSPPQLGTATGTRDQYTKNKMVYPRNPPLSPYFCWLNLLLGGLAQIIYGQAAKGLVLAVATIIAGVVIPILGNLTVCAISIVDAYMVGKALKSGKSIGKWQFFPSV